MYLISVFRNTHVAGQAMCLKITLGLDYSAIMFTCLPRASPPPCVIYAAKPVARTRGSPKYMTMPAFF